MAIVQREGNIFTTAQPAIGHGVNTHGVMGAGIAKEVRERHPDVYEAYRAKCLRGELKPGDAFPVYSIADETNRWIFNLASQDAPGPTAEYKWVEISILNGLLKAHKLGLSGIALPRIGSGIGGLQWDLVEPIIVTAAQRFTNLEIELWKFKK